MPTAWDYSQPPATSLPNAVPFFLNPTGSPDGGPCFQAGAIPDGGVSQARFIAPSAGVFSVGYRVSSEGDYDFLTAKAEFSADNLFRSSGQTEWATATVHLAAGEALDITYAKDGSVANGSDTGWITLHFQADACEIQGQAALRLVSTGNLSGGSRAPIAQPLQGRATLQLGVSTAKLSKLPALQGRATLRLIARNGVITAPTGLAAQMKIIADRIRPEVILDQYLQVWFNGNPSQCQISVQLDGGTEFYPTATWLNPGTTGPAIVKIDSATLPGDGATHQITVKVRVYSAGRTGPWATTTLNAKTPKPRRTVEQPEWCSATLLHQGTATLPDLSQVTWRHDGAVQIFARFPRWIGTSPAGALWTEQQIALDVADYDETQALIEDLGVKMGGGSTTPRAVYFGVAAIDRGQFGVVRWATTPVQIKGFEERSSLPKPVNPDRQAGPVPRWPYSYLKGQVVSAVRAQAPQWTNNSVNEGIVHAALDKTLLKIKDVIRRGGSVTLDDFARFEARWNEERTVRSVGCAFSPGMKEGTKRGVILTDEEAKAA